jgi:ribosomal protein L7/L12
MYDPYWICGEIAEAQARLHALKLAIPSVATQSDDANALQVLVRDCECRLKLATSVSTTVELIAIGEKKLEVIKVVRELTGLGVMEAKDLVEAAPKILKEDVALAEAIEIERALQAAGATVTLY